MGRHHFHGVCFSDHQSLGSAQAAQTVLNVLRFTGLRTGGLQTLEMHCEGNCSSLSIGLLAEDGNCSSGTSPAMFLQVFATLVASATPVTISAAAGQVLTLTCDVACDAFQVHLAEVCRGTGLVPAEVDHGSGAGDSGLRVPVRLAGGTAFSGRVELLHASEWGTICNKNFTDTEEKRSMFAFVFAMWRRCLESSSLGLSFERVPLEGSKGSFPAHQAMVVCNQLGLREGAVLGALPGSGSIWLSAVTCDGSDPCR
eukprot:Skav230992  [mRNA]  locus=scaffold1822:112634:117482:- [translate_table: standard]